MQLRCLLVDDDADNVAALAMVIETLGHHAYTACDAVAALREAARVRPHVAFVDWLMPGTDGIRLGLLLREAQPELFLCLVTGYGGHVLPDDAKAAGFAAHILKPGSLDGIKSLLEQARVHLSQRPMDYRHPDPVVNADDSGELEAAIRSANEILDDPSRSQAERIEASDRLARALKALRNRTRVIRSFPPRSTRKPR